jgi:putative PEP-CTERM system histidine kinase
MNFQNAIIYVAILASLVPVLAVFIRGRLGYEILLATFSSVGAVIFYLAAILKLFTDGPQPVPTSWVYLFVISAVPLLLAGYVLSRCLGSSLDRDWFRFSERRFILLALLGLVFLAFLRHPTFVTGYDWASGQGTIHFGLLGKAYFSYLLIGIVLTGFNLEKTYRIAPSELRPHLRLPLIGFVCVLGSFTFILSIGLLYSSVGLGKLIASALPLIIASLLLSHGHLRGAMTDYTSPVSRNVVYSSFTALAAGLFVVAIGLAAQVAHLTQWSPDEILIVSFGFLAVLSTGLFLFSNRFQRSVRRFIDRNFYGNRYDYRAQWSRITECLEDATEEREVLELASDFLLDGFAASGVTISQQDDVTADICPVFGRGADDQRQRITPDSPLYRRLMLERKSLLLERRVHDMSYIAIYAEDNDWLESTASQLIAPLFASGELVGMIGLERGIAGPPFTFEDVALLDSISTHIAAELHSLRLIQQLSDVRETELMSQWSSMLLHDMKNYLTPLRMAASNLIEFKDNPDITSICSNDIARVTDRMENLMHTLSELRENPKLEIETIEPNQMVQHTLSDLQITEIPGIKLDLKLDSVQVIQVDYGMVRRVLENLINNAVEAMESTGTLSVRTVDFNVNGSQQVNIEVIDSGPGIDPVFLRDGLFRPFATTKKNGLGLGLYQSRLIVQAHSGELSVKSTPGEGSEFRIALNGFSPSKLVEDMEPETETFDEESGT